MPMRQPLVFDRERCALFSILVDRACETAIREGLFLSQDQHKARMMLGGRIISAFEAGESDIEKLQAIALLTDDRRSEQERIIAPMESTKWDTTNRRRFASSQT